MSIVRFPISCMRGRHTHSETGVDHLVACAAFQNLGIKFSAQESPLYWHSTELFLRESIYALVCYDMEEEFADVLVVFVACVVRRYQLTLRIWHSKTRCQDMGVFRCAGR